jgi:two-component system, OmpR family, response regulator MprA
MRLHTRSSSNRGGSPCCTPRPLLRPLCSPAPNGGPVLHFGDLTLDPRTREVRRGDRVIVLTPLEFALLELFLDHPHHVLTRAFIFTRVWGFDFSATSNSLNVYVGYLRRKVEGEGERRLIHTVRGIGYVLR